MSRRRFMSWQFDLLESALAAGTTIALRSSSIVSAAAAGKAPDTREANRMVAEKAQSIALGLVAAGAEYNRLWWHASLRGSFVPAGAWLNLVRAASQPARVTVRRNARRLTRRSGAEPR